MKSEREDYIKTIYKLNEMEGIATHKRICEFLDVSGASVSQMIKKLREADLVKTEKKAILLTANGEKIAKKILSRHRLWETFLNKYLGISWDKVHKHAELLEHVTDDELMEKLSQFLGNPNYCPHGGIIFDNNKDRRKTVPLTEMAVNEQSEIARVYDDSALLKYLKRKKIAIGDPFTIIEKRDFDDSIVIDITGNKIELSHKVASKIRAVR